MACNAESADRSVDYNDKHAKATGKRSPGGADDILTLTRSGIKDAELASLFRNSFVLYACFLMAGSALFHTIGGNIGDMDVVDVLGYVSSCAEHVGLLALRRKIEQQKSVSGISGMTMGMYMLVYTIRFAMMPEFTLLVINEWAVKVLELVSLLLVADVVRCILVTYRNTYQDDLDVLRLEHLVPGCLLLASILHPDLRQGLRYDLFWTSCLYLDVLALMPQVTMMSRSGGKVEAPVSHFVAATALSRSVDLWFWYYAFDEVGPATRTPGSFNSSGWLIVFFHALHLVLVADFMYYYIKARLAGKGLTVDLDIPDIV